MCVVLASWGGFFSFGLGRAAKTLFGVVLLRCYRFKSGVTAIRSLSLFLLFRLSLSLSLSLPLPLPFSLPRPLPPRSLKLDLNTQPLTETSFK